MEVITIDSKAFQKLVEKVDLINDYVREARLEQTATTDDEWVDSQVVCQYLRICEKTLQRLRAAGKLSYSCLGKKYYYQISEIKHLLNEHLIKCDHEMMGELIRNTFATNRRKRA